MSAIAFAYVLVLRDIAAKEELVSLLPPERRGEVEHALNQVKAMTSERIRFELRASREDQRNEQKKIVANRIGISIDRVSPILIDWLARPF